jgi:hypothetical protein
MTFFKSWHKICRGFNALQLMICQINLLLRGRKTMGWVDYDDDDRNRSEHRGGKRQKRFEQDESSNDYRQKRSGKRFHRRKTLKDENWPDDDPRSSPKRR